MLKTKHRIRLEEQIYLNYFESIRTRYRFSAALPLKGENINNRELYFKLNAEIISRLLTFNLGRRPLIQNLDQAQIRINPLLGFKAAKRSNFELGLAYHYVRSAYLGKLEDPRNHLVLLNINWYLSNK